MTALKTALVGLLLVLLAGCDFSVYKMPLPGGADLGDNPFTVTVEFPDVLDLVPQSTVKVNDVTVGKVTDVELVGYQARVELALREDVDLPDNTLAEIRQTSLLGEKFVSLRAPEAPSANKLQDGDVIGVERTNRNPEVEEVLGAMSLLLNGGGVAQLKTIAHELNLALEGREGSARSVLRQIRVFMRELDRNKASIVRAIEQLNRLAVTANQHTRDIESALDNLPAALKSLERQRTDLVKMLQALSQLGNVGTQVIKASKASTIDALTQLQPVLTQLAAADDDFVNAFHVFLTYPFVDEVVGRDPNVARNLHMGDFTNLSVKLDVKLGGGGGGGPALPPVGEACVSIDDLESGVPLPTDLSDLCDGAANALAQCQANPTNCPAYLLEALGSTTDQVCRDLGLPATLCGNTAPPPDDGGGLPGLPDLPGLGRAPVGATAGRQSVTLDRLMARYDPVLVGLLLPGVAR
jgi:phospholipid/cholesterol/gamma-HCH transport system substrate-binding protein